MPQLSQREVLDAAAELLDGHRPAPDLPVDLAVHMALLLDGEASSYTELCRSDSEPGTLVFTLVTGTRILQLTTAARPAADGADISADVWQLAGLRGVRAVPRDAGTDDDVTEWNRPDRVGPEPEPARRRWLLTFVGAPPIRLPVAGRPSAVHTYAASSLAEALVPPPTAPVD